MKSYAVKKHPGLHCATAMPAKEPEFPFLLVEQVADRDEPRTLTSSHRNEARRVRFDVSVFSADPKAPKVEAKRISSDVADAFKAIGFTQVAGGEPVDLTDAQSRAIVRYFSRYEAALHGGVFHAV